MNRLDIESVYKARHGALPARRVSNHTNPVTEDGMPRNVPIPQSVRRQPQAVLERLLARLQRAANGCWEWQGAKTKSGYGKMYANQRLATTHRLAYELLCGPIPDGLHVCHHCDNRACCHPAHLFAGTVADNVRDMDSKGRRNAQKGSDHFKAVVTEKDVAEIRSLFASGTPRAEIALKYGMHETTVRHIASGKTWKHVPGACASRTKPPKLDSKQAQAAHEMRQTGMSYSAIGKAFGVRDMVVIRAIKRWLENCHE